MKKFFIKDGFTMAEVLITLGIIGVVAAITISAVVKNYQKYKTINRLKSTYATLNNALEMAKNDYGLDMNQWETSVSDDEKERSDYFAEHYLIPYIKIVHDCKNTNKKGSCYFWNNARGLFLANGTLIFEYAGQGSGTLYDTRINIVIYTEGKKSGTKSGKNIFDVELGGGWSTSGLDRNKFWPYSYNPATTRDTYIRYIESNKSCCFALIFHDNWQILSDNPCW